MIIKPMNYFWMSLLLSFSLMGSLLLGQTKPVKAQLSSDDGTGSSTSDVGTAAPNLVPSVRQVLPRTTTEQYVTTISNRVTQLQTSDIPVEQNLATVLTTSNQQSENSLTSALVEGGLTQTQANQIVNSIANLFSESEVGTSEGGNVVRNLELRGDQADKLSRSITTYNRVVRNLDNAILQNPPASLLTIRSILLEASQATQPQQ